MAKGIIVVDVPENCEKCQFNKGFNVCKIMQIYKEREIYLYYGQTDNRRSKARLVSDTSDTGKDGGMCQVSTTRRDNSII